MDAQTMAGSAPAAAPMVNDTAAAPPDNVTVAVFRSHAEAEAAVQALQAGGFDMTRLSIVGTDYQTNDHVVGFYNVGDRVRSWGSAGAFWGGIWGLLFGAAFFVIPGVGPVMVAGPLVAAIVGALEGAVVVGGIGAFGAALTSLGVPRNSVLEYETAIKAGKYLLIAHGTEAEVQRARALLATAP